MKKLIFLGIVLGGMIMLIINQNHGYETNIEIFTDDEISKNELKVIINPHGYILEGYEPIKDLGETNIYFVLYKDSILQRYKDIKINKYSDYNIYAKYKNKYAKMSYTNSLVLGENETNISIFIKKHNNIIYMVSSNSSFSTEAINQSSFKDVETFKNNKKDMKMLSYLDQL